MNNKTILVDMGKDVTYVTIINELGSKNYISTKEHFSLNFKSLAEQIIEAYLKRGVRLIYIDYTSFGRGLIDELTVQFEKTGYLYDYKKGTVHYK